MGEVGKTGWCEKKRYLVLVWVAPPLNGLPPPIRDPPERARGRRRLVAVSGRFWLARYPVCRRCGAFRCCVLCWGRRKRYTLELRVHLQVNPSNRTTVRFLRGFFKAVIYYELDLT